MPCAAPQRVMLPGKGGAVGSLTLWGHGGAVLDLGARAPPVCPHREGSVVLEYDALFAAERVQAPGLGALLGAALGSSGTRQGLAVGTAPVLRNVALGECGACTGLRGHRTLSRPLGSGAQPGLVAGWVRAWPRLSAWRGGGGTAELPSQQSGRWTPAPCSSPAGLASPVWPGRTGTPPAPPSATATTARTTASAPTPRTTGPSASECPRDRPWGDGCCPLRQLMAPLVQVPRWQ